MLPRCSRIFQRTEPNLHGGSQVDLPGTVHAGAAVVRSAIRHRCGARNGHGWQPRGAARSECLLAGHCLGNRHGRARPFRSAPAARMACRLAHQLHGLHHRYAPVEQPPRCALDDRPALLDPLARGGSGGAAGRQPAQHAKHVQPGADHAEGTDACRMLRPERELRNECHRRCKLRRCRERHTNDQDARARRPLCLDQPGEHPLHPWLEQQLRAHPRPRSLDTGHQREQGCGPSGERARQHDRPGGPGVVAATRRRAPVREPVPQRSGPYGSEPSQCPAYR